MFSPYNRLRTSLVFLAAAAASLAGCSNEVPGFELEDQAVLDVKDFIQSNLDELAAASEALQADAPAADDDGWNATDDAAAVAKLKEDWKRARLAYESIEGAIAVVFPDLDHSTDARYEDFVEAIPDDNLFDDTGVTGVHGIERILWADSIPQTVVDFEKGLANYKEASFPKTRQEADDFKTKLCARLVADTKQMSVEFQKLALDAPSAYRGVIGSVNEQVEKVAKAATGEEESRYAQYTLADMRRNVEAAKTTYQAFQPWLVSEKDKGGEELDQKIQAQFEALLDGYAQYPGDALPPVPMDWSSENPTAEQLATPFGKLYTLVKDASDPTLEGSLVYEMLASADLLGIAKLPE